MRKRFLATAFAVIVPFAGAQPAQAATFSLPTPDLSPVLSKIIKFTSHLLGSDISDVPRIPAPADVPQVDDKEGKEYVSFDCPGSIPQPVEVDGEWYATGPALCWAPADEVADILAAFAAEHDADKAGDKAENLVSFPCPGAAETIEIDGQSVATGPALCFAPAEEGIPYGDEDTLLPGAADTKVVPCDDDVIIAEVPEGSHSLVGDMLCVVPK